MLTFTVNRDRFPAVTPRYAATAVKVLYLYESRHCSSGGNDQRKERKQVRNNFHVAAKPESHGDIRRFSVSTRTRGPGRTRNPSSPGPLPRFLRRQVAKRRYRVNKTGSGQTSGPGRDCQSPRRSRDQVAAVGQARRCNLRKTEPGAVVRLRSRAGRQRSSWRIPDPAR